MKEFQNLAFNPISEDIVDILVDRTQTDDRDFFRILTAYHLSKIPAMLQVVINSPDRGDIPINFYGVNLAPSGHGKGHATNIFEDIILSEFNSKFMNNVLPRHAEVNIEKLAMARDNKNNIDASRQAVQMEYERAGVYQPVFDSATAPAVKQLRHKIMMGGIGSLNLEIDEIGSNILGNAEALSVYLELYDIGKVKEKLIKHTSDSKHFVPIKGATPTNLMMFGTPTRLLNAAREEEEFYNLMETGYARRCFFGYAKTSNKIVFSDAAKVYDSLTGSTNEAFLNQLKLSMGNLATIDNCHKKVTMERPEAIRLIAYKLACEKEACTYPEYDEIRKAEITHRYFKVLKLTGTYAFISGCSKVHVDHLNQAIALAEESGKAFTALQKREKSYVKLANYLRDKKEEVTYTDMIEDLPFFRGSNQSKQDMLKLAASYGYQNNIVIKSHYTNGIEFVSASSLKHTNLDKIIISMSQDIAKNYTPKELPFNKLVSFGKNNTHHWCNHHFQDGHRQEENALRGFNLLVFDVENSVSVDIAKMLLKGYKAIIYTTKRHDPSQGHERYRVLIPTNYVLEMDKDTYKEFINNLYSWLPFDADTQVGQRARKWLCNVGQVEVLDGELFDVLPFIPQTEKNRERKTLTIDNNSLSNLEKWFANNTGLGNRSNQLHKYAMLLVDMNTPIANITSKVHALNDKLPDPLSKTEVQNTILQSAARKIQEKVKK